jgi:hypothetical protein
VPPAISEQEFTPDSGTGFGDLVVHEHERKAPGRRKLHAAAKFSALLLIKRAHDRPIAGISFKSKMPLRSLPWYLRPFLRVAGTTFDNAQN